MQSTRSKFMNNQGEFKNQESRNRTMFCSFTACAIQKAISKSHPGRSRKDQPLDLVTKIRAWLTILTCKYKADIISCSLPLKSLTWNVLYKKQENKTELCLRDKEFDYMLDTYREEVSSVSSPEENDGHQSHVASKDNAGCEDFFEFPAIWCRRRHHFVL